MHLRLPEATVDLTRREIRPHVGDTVLLSEQEAAILAFLAERAGQPVAREALLAEVLGYKRTSTTRALDNAVLRLRQKLGRGATEALRTVRGVGYELDADVVAVARHDEVDGTPEWLLGRDRELARVRRGLAAGIVVISGLGGIGKTTLARAAVLDRRPVTMVSLAGPRTTESVHQAIASSLGVTLLDEAPAPEVLAAAVRGLDGVLVLDEADHVDPRDLEWIPASAAVLVTSREPLPLPAALQVPLSPLPHDAAVALFVARADTEASPAIEALVDDLDRWPLAIELAAPWLRVATPEQLRARLDRRLAWLTSRGARGRHGSVHAVLLDTWETLSQEARTHLTRLSVLSAPMRLEVVERLLADHPLPMQALADLVDAAVVQVVDTETRRYQVLTTVRDFVQQHGDPEQLRDAARVLADAWLPPLLARPDTAATRRLLPHLEALILVLEGHDPERVGNLVACAHLVAWAEGPPGTIHRLRAALEALPAHGDVSTRLRLGLALAQWCWRAGRHEESVARLDDGLKVAEATGATRARSHLARLHGFYSYLLGDADAAVRYGELTVELARAAGDVHALILGLRTLSLQALADRQLERARQLAQEALREAEDLGEPTHQASLLLTLSRVEYVAGDRATADMLLARAGQLARGSPFAEHMVSHASLGQAELDGDLDAVERRLEDLERAHGELGDAAGEALVRETRARVCAARGQLADAEHHLGHAAARLKRLGMVPTAFRVELQLAACIALRGRIDEARERFERLGPRMPERSIEVGPVSWRILSALVDRDPEVVEQVRRAPLGPEATPIDQVLVRWLDYSPNIGTL